MMKHLITQMIVSISEVMETMFYLPIEHNNQVTIESSGIIDSKDLNVCSITFSGNYAGNLYLLMPTSVLQIMATNFLGEEPETLSEPHLSGTMKEALNMIAGNTFSKIDADTSFGLGVPEILNKFDLTFCDEFIIIETMEGRMCLGLEIYPEQAA